MRVYALFAPDDRSYFTAFVKEAPIAIDGFHLIEADEQALPVSLREQDSQQRRAMLASDAIVLFLSPAALASQRIQTAISFITDPREFSHKLIIAMVHAVDIPVTLRDREILNLAGLAPEEAALPIVREVNLLNASNRSLRDNEIFPEEERSRGSMPAPQEEAPPLPMGSRAPAAAAPSPAPRSIAPPTPVDAGEWNDILMMHEGSSDVRKKTSTSAATDTLHFNAYHPNSLPVGEWQTILVYTYVAAALAQIQADAGTFTELGSSPTTSTGTSSREIKQGVELTIEPHMDGVTFSPAVEAFIWRGDWHRSLFRAQGNAELAGKNQEGWIDIYAGGLVPIARIDIAFPFRSHGLKPMISLPQGVTVTSNVHDRVFISYSHSDEEAFMQACELYKRFGIQIYCDDHLAAGDDYRMTLEQMIDAASIFHLLWSPRSARSPECRKEWARALNREPSERFIKPWYWKKPLVTPPREFAEHHISFRYQHLTRKWWKPETW